MVSVWKALGHPENPEGWLFAQLEGKCQPCLCRTHTHWLVVEMIYLLSQTCF